MDDPRFKGEPFLDPSGESFEDIWKPQKVLPTLFHQGRKVSFSPLTRET
jgi:hypothetical protein